MARTYYVRIVGAGVSLGFHSRIYIIPLALLFFIVDYLRLTARERTSACY